MSEEDAKKEELPETIPEESLGNEHQEEPNEVEVQASEKGWVPKEKYQGDPEAWVDAKEFISRGPLYDALHSANRKIKSLQETMDAFKEHHNKVETRAREKALAELKDQLKVASEERDIGAALEIKDKITSLSQEATEVQPNTVFNTWVESNQWYKTDNKLKTFATGIGFGLAQENPSWSVEQVYNEVTKIVKEEFPEKFNKKPNKVTSANQTVNNDGKSNKRLPSANQLPEDARKNYRKLVKSTSNPNGPLTHAEFMSEYLQIGGTINGAD